MRTAEEWKQTYIHTILGGPAPSFTYDEQWTKRNFKNVTQGKMPFGFTTYNNVIAMYEFVKEHYPDRLNTFIETYKAYLVNDKIKDMPLVKMRTFFDNL